MSAGNAALFTQQLWSADFARRKSVSKQIMWVGDSITETSVGATRVAGIRGYELQWVVDNGLSVDHVGNRTNGKVPDRENVAQGGADCATIATNVANAFAANPAFAPDLIVLMMGTNNISGGSTGTQIAAYSAALISIYNTAVARNPAVKIAVSTITPIQPGTSPGDTNWSLFNAALIAAGSGAWDTFEATRPGTLIRCDNAAALGNAWSSGDFGSDTTHPNETGCAKIGARGILQNYGLTIRALSPTIKPLTCVIKSPVASASIPYGSPVTISGRVSRYPSTVQVKLGATVLGSATMSKRDWSFSWTPVSGDLGARTLNATVTDTLDSSTADAAGVAITVAAPAYSPADEGNAIGAWDVSDATARTVDGSNNLTAIKNIITGVTATEASAPPLFVAAGGPDGVKPCATFVAASSNKLQSGTDSTFGAGLSGDDHAFTFIGAFRLASLAYGTAGFVFSAANTVQVLGFGQAAATYRVFKNPDANTGSVNQQSVALVSGWTILQVTFDGAAKTVTTRINNGTPITSAFDTTTQAINKWALGCSGGTFPAVFGGFDFLEAWMFSDNKLGAGVSGGKDAVDRVFNHLNTKWAIGLTPR